MANTNLQLIKYMKEMQEKHKRHNLPSLRRAVMPYPNSSTASFIFPMIFNGTGRAVAAKCTPGSIG